jgi:hypothetical protein
VWLKHQRLLIFFVEARVPQRLLFLLRHGSRLLRLEPSHGSSLVIIFGVEARALVVVCIEKEEEI